MTLDCLLLLPTGAVVLSSGFSNGTGPIFLDQLDCQGTENTLLECNAFIPQRLLICDHSQDVAIRCTGRFCHGRDITIVYLFTLYMWGDVLIQYFYWICALLVSWWIYCILQKLADIDECTTDNGECEQTCTNTIGSFYCTCEFGYQLDENRLNCSGETCSIMTLRDMIFYCICLPLCLSVDRHWWVWEWKFEQLSWKCTVHQHRGKFHLFLQPWLLWRWGQLHK